MFIYSYFFFGGEGWGGRGPLICVSVSDTNLSENRELKHAVFHTVYFTQQSVGHLTRRSGVLGSIPGLATYFRFSFRFFKKGSCQLLAKVCTRSTG